MTRYACPKCGKNTSMSITPVWVGHRCPANRNVFTYYERLLEEHLQPSGRH